MYGTQGSENNLRFPPAVTHPQFIMGFPKAGVAILYLHSPENIDPFSLIYKWCVAGQGVSVSLSGSGPEAAINLAYGAMELHPLNNFTVCLNAEHQSQPHTDAMHTSVT